jgi:hypothetical protein
VVAQVTKAYTLITSLLPRLQNVLIANGYATDAGASVAFGPIPRMDGEAMPFIRLLETGAELDSEIRNRPSGKLRVNFVAEAYAEQPTAASLMDTGHTLVGDLKKALFGDPLRDLNGGAIEARLEGYSIVSPEEGSDVVIAQVRGSFTFHDDFTSP